MNYNAEDAVDTLAILLAAVLCLIISAPAKAQELTFSTNGFATYTAFSDNAFHPDQGKIAQNFAVHYGDYAIKGQVSNSEYEPIRRLAVEYSGGEFRNNYFVQIGRIPRLTTLFSDVYGNPAEWDLAVLPLSTYNRRKVHSLAFQALDGIKFVHDANRDWGGIRTTINVGRTIQEYVCEWQMEATRKPCMTSWEFTPKNDNYDVAFETRIGTEWTLLASYNRLHLGNQLVKPDKIGLTFNTLINELDYRFTRIGIRYDADWGYLQTEKGESRLHFLDKRKGWGVNSTAYDYYVLGGFYVTDQVTGYAGYAAGHERGSTYYSRDGFVGAVFRNAGWSYSLERHWGDGSWQRIDSPKYHWATWVGSVTYVW